MKTWLITGCSSGIGRSLAKAVLQRGYNAVVTARNTDTLKEFKDEYPKRALILKLDVTHQDDIENVVKFAQEEFGSIDVLVNNAGYGYRAALEEGNPKDVAVLFNTNVWGPVALMKEVLPLMRKQKSGAIINVSSIAAIRTAPGSSYYAASKSALEALTDGLKKEVNPLGIKVMIVEPDAFRTDFAGRSLIQSQAVIKDYENTAGQRRIEKDKTYGTQPGNPDKAAKIIIDVIEDDYPPLRLLLGSDAIKVGQDVLNERLQEYKQWEHLSCQSDFDN